MNREFQNSEKREVFPQEKKVSPLASFFKKTFYLGKEILKSFALKSIKEGTKRLVSFLVKKLGIKAALTAAGTAIAPGIGTAVALFLNAILFIVQKIYEHLIKPVVLFLVRSIKKPERAIMIVAAGLGIIIFFPGASILGVSLLGFGGLGLLGSAGGILKGAAAGINSFFNAILFPSASTAPITIFTLVIIGILFISTFLIVITTAAAFILPTAPVPRHISPTPPSIITPACEADLINLIKKKANDNCVPATLLMAISRMEAGGVWSLTCEEIEKFSRDEWWKNASQEELKRGYCYDTCAATGLCRGTTVMGPMQFEEQTWKTYMPTYDPMNRCRLDLSFEAAAKKIKTDSGTTPLNCTSWAEETIRKVAQRYCGSCGTEGCKESPLPGDPCSPACGIDYCGSVLILYKEYQRLYGN